MRCLISENQWLDVSFVPVLFAALLDHHSNMGPAEIPAKRRYTILDTQRWAIHLGLTFKSPPAHPFNPLKALRVTSALDNDGLRESLAVRLLDAAWSDGRDITSDTVICEIADSIGLNGQELLGKAQTAGCSVSQPLQWTMRSFGEMTGFRF